MEVDIGISQGTTSDGISTDADGGYGTDSVEDFKKEAFVDFWG